MLLCENNTGYKNLIKLVSAGFIDGFYKKPRVDKELLRTLFAIFLLFIGLRELFANKRDNK